MTLSERNAETAVWADDGVRSGQVVPIGPKWPVLAPPAELLPSAKRRADSGLQALLRCLQHLLNANSVIALRSGGQRSAVVIGVVGQEPDPQAVNGYMSQLTTGANGSSETRLSLAGRNTWITVDSDPVIKDSALLLQVPCDTDSSIVIVAVRHAPRPGFASVDQRAARQAVPWVGEFLTMWWELQRERKRSAGLQASLDQVGLPMIRLDCDAHVIGVNRAARALLAGDDGLKLVSDTLTAAKLEDDVKLQAAIRHVLAGGEPGASAPVLAIRRKDRRPLIVSVLRVPSGRRRGDTAVVLQVVEPELERSAALTAICILFGLTGAETRLATLLATGISLAEAATALRIQLPTARAYLRQAFDKTGTNRQAALVHLLMSSLMHPAPDTRLRVL